MDKKDTLSALNDKYKLIVRYVRSNPGKTPPEIIQALSLTRAHAYNIISRLGDCGILNCTKSTANRGERGRSPELWNVNHNFGSVIGVEFWNRWIAVGLVDFGGRILLSKTSRFPVGFSPNGADDFAGKVLELITNVIEESALPAGNILGIGLVAPGRLDLQTKDAIFYSHHKGFFHSDLLQRVEKHFGLPVIFQHNLYTYTMAEFQFGGGRGIPDQLTILWRSDIGAAAIQKGRPLFPDPGHHLRFGHMIINFDGPLCRCGQNGCLENYVSESFVINEIIRRAKSEGSMLQDYPEITLDLVSEAISRGDRLCCDVIEEAGNKVGIAILNLMKTLDLSLINIIGFTDTLAATLAAGVKKTLEKYAPEETRRMLFKSKGYDPFIGLRGATETFLDSFLN